MPQGLRKEPSFQEDRCATTFPGRTTPRTRVDREGERPIQKKTRPNTGEDPEQASQIETPSTDGPSPSTKTGSVSLPVAKTPEEREGLTRGTNAPSDATGECASEGAREGPAA